MRPFGLWPLLFASPSPDSTTTTVTTTVKSSSTSATSPVGQIVKDSSRLYRDLEEANISTQYSPTIKFSFVAPPSATDTSSWRCTTQKDALGGADAVEDDDRSSFFECIAATHSSTKPLALYLPGLDGKGISATSQFDDLAETFEFHRMSITPDDRTSFGDLVTTVAKFIEDAAVTAGRDVIVIGESFGGLLAPAVATRVRNDYFRAHNANEDDDELIYDPIKGLVLVNPATSFDETNWSTLAPILASLKHLQDDDERDSPTDLPFGLPTPYSVVGGLTLAALIPDSNQFKRILSLITDTPVSNRDDLTDILENMAAGFGILDDNLPPGTIEHRVGRWLPVGTQVVTSAKLAALDVPTLVIAGQDDNMLPTKKEAARLAKVMPRCSVVEIAGSGHFVLDDRVNLTRAILDSDIAPIKLPEIEYDPITDWRLPNDDVVKETIENQVKPLRNLVSPVFFSTGQDGSRRMGLSALPPDEDGKPMLFVANHQFGGLDLGLIISQLIEERNIKARGLAHPFIFQGAAGGATGGAPDSNNGRPAPPKPATTRGEDAQGGGGNGGNGGLFGPDLFQNFGAVMVTPRNYYRLMQTGQTALLFPGGVREVFHGKDEAHQLFWPDKVDFVRIAAKWNATVIPISAVGASDSVNILIDAPDILKLPFGIGARAANSSSQIMSARFDGDAGSELFQPPFALPKPLPARHYFVFGKPMKTDAVDHKDMEGCENFYQDVQSEMYRGFEDVLRAREQDPWKETGRRVAFEQLTGKVAPTFPLNELQQH